MKFCYCVVTWTAVHVVLICVKHVLLGHGALYRAKVAYSQLVVDDSIEPFVGSVCLSVQCTVAKQLIGYGCGLGW